MLNVIKHCKKSCPVVLNNMNIMNGNKTNISKIVNYLNQTNHRLMRHNSVRILPTPIKSDNDHKEYKVIQLENGLTACLISDTKIITPCIDVSDSDEDTSSSDDDSEGSNITVSENEDNAENEGQRGRLAAAALCVGVGSFNDPKNIPGLAHLLEHMISMGNEKYPQENFFDELLGKYEGSYNAETNCEKTTFYFECLQNYLFESLDVFANFFVSPLIKQEAINRERDAVESEFQSELFSDGSRLEQLMCSLAQESSPVNGFSWGNLITLRDNISDGEIQKELHKFKNHYYSAHNMTLAVQAPMPLEDLQRHVVKLFSNIPSNNLPNENLPSYIDIFDMKTFNTIHYIQPVRDICEINLIWVFPPLINKYKSKPYCFFEYLLEYKGAEGLEAFLVRKHLINSLEAGNLGDSFNHNRIYSLFYITLDLTEKGSDHIAEIIEIVFSYLTLIKNQDSLKRNFEEIQAISETDFKFTKERAAIDNVQDIAEAMHDFPSEDILCGDEIFFEYDPDGLKQFLHNLTPENVGIQIIKKDPMPNIQFDMTEKWFGTNYTVKNIPPEWLTQWKNPKINPVLNLPFPNMFITNDFSILQNTNRKSDYPEKIFHNRFGELWYRQDVKFKIPHAYYYFYLISPLALASAKHRCLLEILTNLIIMCLSEECASATNAGLFTKVDFHESGLIIKCWGYNQHLERLINIVFDNIIKLASSITVGVFENVKDELLKHHYNRVLNPLKIANDIRLHLITNVYWNSADLYSTIMEIEIDDIQQFIKNFLKRVYIKTLVQGNVREQTALETMTFLLDKLKSEEIDVEEVLNYKIIKLDPGESCFRVKNFNKYDSNSIVINYYQYDVFTLQANAKLELIQKIIDEPLFNQLRTIEQLGYDISNFIHDTHKILGFSIKVNTLAGKYSTQYINERIEKCLENTKEILSNLSKKSFEKIKTNMINAKRCDDLNLKEEVDNNWNEIISDYYTFDREEQDVEAVKAITLEDLKSWWESYNAFGNKQNFRKLTLQVVGVETAEKKSFVPSKRQIIEWKMLGTEEDAALENRNKDYFITSINKFKENKAFFKK